MKVLNYKEEMIYLIHVKGLAEDLALKVLGDKGKTF